MTPREEARNKAKELLKKVDDCVCGDINERNAKDMVLLIIDEILQTNPTIKGNSDDFITMIVQTKAYWHLVKEELETL